MDASLTCTKCGEARVADLFPKDRARTNGRKSHCKLCQNKLTAAWREAHPTRVKELNRDNYERLKRNADWQVYYRAVQRARRRTPAGAVDTRKRSKQSRERMDRSYVIRALFRGSTVPNAAVPDWLIELKREHIRLVRELRIGKEIGA
jgi:hypothetical protein